MSAEWFFPQKVFCRWNGIFKICNRTFLARWRINDSLTAGHSQDSTAVFASDLEARAGNFLIPFVRSVSPRSERQTCQMGRPRPSHAAAADPGVIRDGGRSHLAVGSVRDASQA